MSDTDREGVRAYLAFQIEAFRREQAEAGGYEYLPLTGEELADRVETKIIAAVAYHAAEAERSRDRADRGALDKVAKAQEQLAAAEESALLDTEAADRAADELETVLQIAGGG